MRDEQMTPETSTLGNETRARKRTTLTAIIASGALLLGVMLGILLAGRGGPTEIDTGFARDMSTHHQQAVLMASFAADRSEDPEIKSLAYDILTTQHGQVGQMRGWLTAWDEPLNSSNPPMAWMGHPVPDGQMPGMATPEEITNLRELTGTTFDIEFLRLMRDHHEGGVHMAAAAEEANRPEVRNLAKKMADTQAAEIETIENLLEARTGTVPTAESSSTPADHHHN